jgi:fatty acid amide hydrolase
MRDPLVPSPGDDVIHKGLRELSGLLARGALTSSDVVEAFLARIDEVQKPPPAGFAPYARPLPQLARALAKESDERRKRGEARGPLDGVPVSIKENVDIAGEPSTLGLPSRKGHTAERDSVVVSLLRDAGAVFLGKTNLSQALLFHEARNPVYGQTANPFHPGRSPGGSSGGEAAAIAAYASPGGVGTDIGGSIRIPCAWDGVCGLKPTNDRWSNLGSSTAVPGFELIRGQIGPIARTVDDLALLLEVVTPEKCARRDPRTAPLPIAPYRDVDVTKLRVGWFVDDGIVRPSTAVERGVRMAVDALAKAGAQVEHYTPFLVEDALFTYLAGFSSDGAATLHAQIDEKDLDVALRTLWRVTRMPDIARKAAGKALGLTGEKHVGKMLEVLGEKPVAELWRLTKRARDIAAETMSTWDRLGLDVVVCPPHATPALQHEASSDFTLGGSGSMFWNLVNFPAGVVPVTTVRDDEARRANPRGRLEKRAASIDDGSAGLPIGVQVVARPFREDLVLAAMAAVERDVVTRDGFPRIRL